MNFSVTILGCSSATPTLYRNPSAQVLNIHERLFLIDCGEGTQMQFRKYKIRFQKINHIFISHLHGDHYLGLMGLLFTYHLFGREKELHIYSFPELKEIVDIQMKVAKARLVYPLIFHDLKDDKPEIIYEDDILSVETIILNHRIPTCGFLFKEKKRPKNILKEFLQKEDVPYTEINKIKNGKDYTNPQGKTYKNETITADSPAPRNYAYCSDTGYLENIIPQIKKADLLYHEATFMEDKADSAKEKLHSTAKQAATIAKKANVKQLLIGHYSTRYEDLNPMLEEATSVFPDTLLAEEGKIIIL